MPPRPAALWCRGLISLPPLPLHTPRRQFHRHGYQAPTLIQAQAWPIAMEVRPRPRRGGRESRGGRAERAPGSEQLGPRRCNTAQRDDARARFGAPDPRSEVIHSASPRAAPQGRDLVAVASTGSGKTAGFLVPGILHIRDIEMVGGAFV